MKKIILFLILLFSSLAEGQFWESPIQKPQMSGIRINRVHILGDPVGLWLFSEGFASQVFDLSGNGKNGILTNGPTWDAGTLGPGVRTSGSEVTEDHINIGDHSIHSFGDGTTDRPLTIIVGYKPDSDAVSHTLVCKADDVATTLEYALRLRADGGLKPDFSIYDNTVATDRKRVETANVISNPTSFHQFAVTYDGSKTIAGINLYVDDIVQAKTTLDDGGYGGMHDTAASLRFGVQWYDNETYDEFADGLFEYVMIYKRVLTPSEIALLYREPFCMIEPLWDWNLYFGMSFVPPGAGQFIFIN